jgi:hypothetical protein
VSLREIPKLGQAVEIRYRDGHAVVSALSPVDALPAPLSTDTPAVRSAKQRFRTEGMVASSEDKSTFEALPRSTRMRM